MTVTGTTPTPAGVVAVIDVPAELTLTTEPAVLPNATVASCVNPEPVMITEVPPAAGPEPGVIAETEAM